MNEPTLSPTASLRDAVALIERTRRLLAPVVDAEGRLLGILSDGDIRRALLSGLGLEAPASAAMTRQPITGPAASSRQELLDIMVTRGVAAIPVVDTEGRFERVIQAHDFALDDRVWSGGEGYAAAVIMAGGEGRRLRPLTLDRPKPMIDIGGVPLLERQVRAMVRSGLRRIYISTNYLGHVIESHFGDGTAFGTEIRYIREARKLGTAGALSLLPEAPSAPLLVINGDILTTSDFGKLLAYHREMRAGVTIAAMVYRVAIPFGVLQVDGHRVRAVEEKPSQSFLCNAGIYVLAPDTLALVPPETEFNMTDLIAAAVASSITVTAFPIHEYWTDIGNPGDLERALREFKAMDAP